MFTGKITIVDALQSLTPDALWVIRGEDGELGDYSNLEWASQDIEKPSELEIINEIKNLEEKYNLEQEAILKAESDKELARESALVKLAKLGLTENEARAVIGF